MPIDRLKLLDNKSVKIYFKKNALSNPSFFKFGKKIYYKIRSLEMKIEIKEINTENLMDILKLTTNKTNIPTLIEGFVASNALSIAQSKFYPEENIKAIYNDTTPIGFAMYGIDDDDNNLWISRFMIDYNHQGQGLGKKSFIILLDTIKNKFPNMDIYLSFEPENEITKKLYESCGFINTEVILDEEIVYILQSEK